MQQALFDCLEIRLQNITSTRLLTALVYLMHVCGKSMEFKCQCSIMGFGEMRVVFFCFITFDYRTETEENHADCNMLCVTAGVGGWMGGSRLTAYLSESEIYK